MSRVRHVRHRPLGKVDLPVLLALCVLIALFALVALSSLSEGEVVGSAPPSAPGTGWTIDQDTLVSEEALALDGDLVVATGRTLVLLQSDLRFRGTASDAHALVVEEGACLVVDGCTLTADEGAPAFELLVRGEAHLARSDISRVRGGVQALSDGLVVERCWIHDCDGPAIELHGHSATISGCTIFGVDVGVSSNAPLGDVGVMTVDGWTLSLSDTTISAKSYGVNLVWNKTMSGTLDLDFLATLTNVEISGCTNDGIRCHMDLKDNGGSGALDSLLELKVTGGFSKNNGGDGIHIEHYIKPVTMSGTTNVAISITLKDTKLNSNTGHGLFLHDTYYCQQGSAPSIKHTSEVTLTGCDVSSNKQDGLHVYRYRYIYYAYGTGGKTRTGTISLTDTTVRSNKGCGVWAYDYHYCYNSKSKYYWTNTIKLLRATIEGNGDDGINHYLYELLYYGDRVGVDYKQSFDFQDSTVASNGDNGFDLTSSGYMYYHGTMSLRNDVKVLRCVLSDNTNLAGYTNFQMYGYDWQYTFYRRGGWTVEDCRIEGNGNGGIAGKCGGWSYYAEFDMIARILGNTVRANGGDRAFGFEGMSGNKGEALATGNAFDDNGGGGGTVALDLLYFSQFVIYDNVFRNDSHRALIRCVAPATAGPSPNVGPKYNDWIQIYENVFEDCDTGAGWTDGAAVIEGYTGNGALRFADNVLSRCAGTALATKAMGGKGALVAKDNVLEAVGGSGFAFTGSTSTARAEVYNNVMRNGTGQASEAFVHIQDDAGSTIVVRDNLAENSSCAGVVSTGSSGPGSLTVKNNRLLALGGNAIDLVGNRFDVRDNELRDCKGFAIALRGFTSLPTVGVNLITGAENGLLLEAKERSDGRRLLVELDNITWQVNGTAISTNHMDLVITNSTLDGRRALMAADGTIRAISTKVPYISGSTSGDGRIEVYYSLGLNLSWADSKGVGSGLPCPDALVVFRRSTGSYFTSRIAGPDGRTPQELIPAWMVVNGQLDQLSPYDLEITASGLTTHAELVLEDDHIADVLVVDWALPAITIEKPYQGALVNTMDLTVKGFLSEMGSGVTGAWASTDGQTWTRVKPEEIWSVRFEGLGHGPARIYAKAADRSGNVNVTVVDFTVDLRGPDLEVLRPLDGTQTRDSYIIVEARSEKTAELYLDGVLVPNRNGAMFERMHLRQGLNIIVVEAVDGSGNAAIQVLHVWLDTVPPALFVSSPVDGEVAADSVVTVEGRTEASATVTINDEPVMVGPDGWFRTTYQLTSRENLLIVASEDPAGNVNTSYVRVTLDDKPPSFIVTTPEDGMLTSRAEVEVEGAVGQEDLDATVYVNGRRIDHVGRFTTTVVLVEGENRITVDVADPNGRVSTQVIRVTRDTAPPVVDLTSPPARSWMTRSHEAPFRGLAPGASEVWVGGQRVILSPDGSFNHTFLLDAGTNSIELEARDAAGNVWAVELTVTWDQSPPDLRVAAPPAITQEESVLINGTTDGVLVRVNGVPVVVADGAFSVPVRLGTGDNVFMITSEDAAGNVMSYEVSIERTAGMQTGGGSALPAGLGITTIVPLVLTIVALLATATLMRRATRVPVRTNGRARPNGRGNGNGRYAAAPAPLPEPEPLVIDVPAAPSAPPAASVPTDEYTALYGAPPPATAASADGAPAYGPPAYEPPAYATSPYEPPVHEAPLHEPLAYEAPAYEPPAYEPSVAEVPSYHEAPAPAAAPELKLEFAPLPVYSVPDPLTVGEVEIGRNGEYSAIAQKPAGTEAPSVTPVATGAPAAAVDALRCTRCGFELEPEWILCPECETPTGAGEPTPPEAAPAIEPGKTVERVELSAPVVADEPRAPAPEEPVSTLPEDGQMVTGTVPPTHRDEGQAEVPSLSPDVPPPPMMRAFKRLERALTDEDAERLKEEAMMGATVEAEEPEPPEPATPLQPSRAERRFFTARPSVLSGIFSSLSTRGIGRRTTADEAPGPEPMSRAEPEPEAPVVHAPEPELDIEPAILDIEELLNGTALEATNEGRPSQVEDTEPELELDIEPEERIVEERVVEERVVEERIVEERIVEERIVEEHVVEELFEEPAPVTVALPAPTKVHVPESAQVAPGPPVLTDVPSPVDEPRVAPYLEEAPVPSLTPAPLNERKFTGPPRPVLTRPPRPVPVRPTAAPRPTPMHVPRPVPRPAPRPMPVAAPRPSAVPEPERVPSPSPPAETIVIPEPAQEPAPEPPTPTTASPTSRPIISVVPRPEPVVEAPVAPSSEPAPTTLPRPDPAPTPPTRPSMHVLPGPVPPKNGSEPVLFVAPVPEQRSAPMAEVVVGPREEVNIVRPPAPRPVPKRATMPVPTLRRAPVPVAVPRPPQQAVSKPKVRSRFFGASAAPSDEPGPAPYPVPPPPPSSTRPADDHVPTASELARQRKVLEELLDELTFDVEGDDD